MKSQIAKPMLKLVEKHGEIMKSEVAKIMGITLHQAELSASYLRRTGWPLGIKRLGKQKTMYFIDYDIDDYKPLYEKIYEKMALDTPREEWSRDELIELFDIRTQPLLKELIRSIRRNICPVHTRISYTKPRQAYYRLGDLDGKKE